MFGGAQIYGWAGGGKSALVCCGTAPPGGGSSQEDEFMDSELFLTPWRISNPSNRRRDWTPPAWLEESAGQRRPGSSARSLHCGAQTEAVAVVGGLGSPRCRSSSHEWEDVLFEMKMRLRFDEAWVCYFTFSLLQMLQD